MNAPRQTPAYRLVLTLGLAGFLSGLIIVGFYEWTRPKILAHQAESLRKAVFEVLPGAATMRPLVQRAGEWQIAAEVPAEAPAEAAGEAAGANGAGNGSPGDAGATGSGGAGASSAVASTEDKQAAPGERAFAAFDAGGGLLGYAFEAEGGGFQDVIRLLYGFDPGSRRIVGMRILESRETPGLGDKIYKDPKFVHGFDALAVDPEIVLVKGAGSGSPNEVHAITGATISSRAVVEILKKAQALWGAQMPPAPGGTTSNLEPTGSGGESRTESAQETHAEASGSRQAGASVPTESEEGSQGGS
jgi:electron transport complex protein RnfG